MEILPHKTWIRGISWEGRWRVAEEALVGMVVDLDRDYDNEYDRNAVSILLNGKQLGYLERRLAQLAAPQLDAGITLYSTITTIERKETTKIEIEIRNSEPNSAA